MIFDFFLCDVFFEGGGGAKMNFPPFLLLLIWSNVNSVPNFRFLEVVILTIPGVGWAVGLLSKSKLQPNLG